MPNSPFRKFDFKLNLQRLKEETLLEDEEVNNKNNNDIAKNFWT